MKTFLTATIATVLIPAAAFAADVGVAIEVGEPGFFGRIELGDFPKPQVIFPQPIVIQTAPAGVVRHPMYLHIPPGHEKHWDKHCHKYGACGHPVYFVTNSWYSNDFSPAHKKNKGKNGNSQGKGAKDKGNKDKGKK